MTQESHASNVCVTMSSTGSGSSVSISTTDWLQGWTCPYCNQWVPMNTTHYCSNWIWQTPNLQQQVNELKEQLASLTKRVEELERDRIERLKDCLAKRPPCETVYPQETEDVM